MTRRMTETNRIEYKREWLIGLLVKNIKEKSLSVVFQLLSDLWCGPTWA